MTRSIRLPQTFASFVLRGVLLLAGGVFALALLVAGLIAAAVMLLANLLRGRRPVLPLPWRVLKAALQQHFAARRQRAPRPSAHRSARRGEAEVIDIEAREIPTTRLPQQH